MFEIGVICIVVLAVGYWVTLWLMGRHEDVLHGDFIHAEPADDAADALPGQIFPGNPPPFPVKPPAIKPSVRKPAPVKPAPVKPAPAAPLPASTSPVGPDPSDTLQALLASIKRDLKDASQL
jgi:hypothetical protein